MARPFPIYLCLTRTYFYLLRFLVVLLSSFLCFAAPAESQHRGEKPREDLHAVISRQRLSPPLRTADFAVRYSSDGKYILLQNQSGIYVVSASPLKLQTYIRTGPSYPARFSPDSQSVITVSFGLTYGRWNIADGQNLKEEELPIHDGCVDASLSPDGSLLACYRPDLTLGLYKFSSAEWIFSCPVLEVDPRFRFFPVPLDLDTAFASPFGYVMANDLKPVANRGLFHLPMAFSPDGATLAVGEWQNEFRVDILGRKKISLPGKLKKYLTSLYSLADGDRILVADAEKSGVPALLSLATGDVLSRPVFKADVASFASNPRYALLHDSSAPGVRVFDLEHDRSIDTPENIGADIYNGQLAVFSEAGDLFLYHFGENLPVATTKLPLTALPILRSASLSPSQDEIAFSVDGIGGLFRVADGQRVGVLPRFASVNFSAPSDAAILLPPHPSDPQRISRLDAPTGATSPDWSAEQKEQLHAGGVVLWGYSFEDPHGGGIPLIKEDGLPFRLRALDPFTGKELWKRSFFSNSPVPFADPQGERLVLGWPAKSEGASSAAKHDPAVKEVYKKAKLAKLDTFFEVLDAHTGKSLGGVLVQVGAGAASFYSAFSVGDYLIVQKEPLRLTVYSLRDGEKKASFAGILPTASAHSNLFAMQDMTRHLNIYDLATFTKLDQQLCADELAYMHFSVDGKRLFVLTEHQEAFLLDVSHVREPRPASPESP